jgi:hypothetical protein
MPLELGIFYGAKIFGSTQQKSKVCLVLCKERFEYQKYISDFAGQDFQGHDNEPRKIMPALRSFLSSHLKKSLPSPKVLWDHYELFSEDLRVACAADKLEESELQFWERLDLANKWFTKNLPGRRP